MRDEIDALFSPVGEVKDQELIDELQKRGYLAHKPAPAVTPVDHDLSRLRGDRIKFGIVSDTHFGSKFQQPTLLREHLAYMKTRKVDAIMVGGDVTDGSTQMHPGFEYELWAHGFDAQRDAALEVLVPEAERLKVPWYFIGGNHDNSHWKAAGADIVDQICASSEWFHYLSPDGITTGTNARNSVGYVRFGKLTVQISHPHKGGAYALSYTGQKWIEQLSPENKPHIALMGNFHKALWMEYRNVSYFMLPAFQAQSAWMGAKGIASIVGSVILDVGVEPKGMAPSVQTEWLIERTPIENDWPGGR